MSETEKIGDTIIKKVPGMEEVKMSSLWANQRTVVIFFRRFGCLFCRHSAKEISTLAPILSASDVRLVGIGMEDIGLDEFIRGEYFQGEVFLDTNRETYKALGFKKLGYLSMITSFMNKQTKEVYAKSKANGVTGNMKGDGFQQGGCLVMSPGGGVLLSFKQETPADLADNDEILRVLGIEKPKEVEEEPIVEVPAEGVKEKGVEKSP